MDWFSSGALRALDGAPLDGSRTSGRVLLVVNVASRCGLTPQYDGLMRLQERFSGQPFTVVGVPCNQFGAQERGSAEEIAEFCSATYGVTFPLTEKLEVNGRGAHPLFAWLAGAPDLTGRAGEIEWNFEKFLLAPWAEVLGRFRPTVEPESPALVSAIADLLDLVGSRQAVPAHEVAVGDRLLLADVGYLRVSRIDRSTMGRSDRIWFVDDSPARWLKISCPLDATVERIER